MPINKGFPIEILMDLIPDGYYGTVTYLALHTTNPSTTSDGVEVSGTGYARIPVRMSRVTAVGLGFGLGPLGSTILDPRESMSLLPANTTGPWVQSVDASDNWNTSVNYWWGAPHVFTAGGTWGDVTSWSLWTAASGGDLIFWTPVGPWTIGNGDTVSVYPAQYYDPGDTLVHSRYGVIDDFNDHDITTPSAGASRIQVTRATTWLDTSFPTSGFYMGLHSTAPDWEWPGEDYDGTELTGGGYARQPVTFSSATTSFPVTKTSSAVAFSCSSGSWSVDGFGIWPSSGASQMKYFQKFSAPITVNAGQTITVPSFRIRGF